MNQQCQNPCDQKQCTANTDCRVKDHVAKCYCREGYEGDPERFCSPIQVPDCRLDQDCASPQGCLDGHCIDLCQELQPCSPDALCQVLDTKPMKAMTCVCPAGYSGDPQFSCVPGEHPFLCLSVQTFCIGSFYPPQWLITFVYSSFSKC